jgi:hypothetical protein
MILRTIYLTATFLFIASYLLAQGSTVRQAQSRMEKGKWEAAKEVLIKGIKKDTLNAELYYGLSRWFFHPSNPSYQLDSAHHYSLLSINLYSQLPAKQKERLQRQELDSVVMILLREKIDSAAFVRAKAGNTENAYNFFIQHFKYASEIPKAIELRDEVGFLDALKSDTWKSFQQYFTTYPKSHRKEEAMTRYHKLLFEDKTGDHKLESYRAFVKDFPESPYAEVAHQQIFEISTSIGSVEAFIEFIHTGGTPKNVEQARNLLFHLLKQQEVEMPTDLITDSLRNVADANKGFWVPFFHSGRFGLMDSLGHEKLPAEFKTISENYLCGNIREDVISTDEGLYNRLGKRFASVLANVTDIGFGFLKVGDSTCAQLLHKSGVTFFDSCMEDIKVVGNSFIAARRKGLWGLYTFTGRTLFQPIWDDIQSVEGVVVFTRLGRKILFTPSQVATISNKNTLKEELIFDEVRPFGKGTLLVRDGDKEGILTSQLEFSVPLEQQHLSVAPYGLLKEIKNRYVIEGISVEMSKLSWDHVTQRSQWLILERAGQQEIYNLSKKEILKEEVDSAWLDKGLLFISNTDSIHVYSTARKLISFASDFKFSFVPARDSVMYFYTEGRNKKSLYEIKSGIRLFTYDFNRIESLTPTVFLITRKNKMGLLARNEKLLLPIEYDAIVQTSGSSVSLYKDKKFGLYDLINGRLIKPQYDRNVIFLNTAWLAASKDKLYGLMDWEGKPLTAFTYDEIQPWNDKLVWARKQTTWQLMDVATGKVILDKVSDFQVTYTANDVIARITSGQLHGIFSKAVGTIIPVAFSTIVNIGSEEYPFYFTDKEVREADIHVVLYYNKEGKLLKKVVCEEEDFERIYCEGN